MQRLVPHGYNVHNYSTAWSDEAKQHLTVLQASVPPDEWNELLRELQESAPKSIDVIQSFGARYVAQDGGYFDNDLANVNVSRLLLETWSLIKDLKDHSIYHGFEEILDDIRDTCLQGQSHRLFAYWIALSRDKTNIS
jgi:hypothetical protein